MNTPEETAPLIATGETARGGRQGLHGIRSRKAVMTGIAAVAASALIGTPIVRGLDFGGTHVAIAATARTSTAAARTSTAATTAAELAGQLTSVTAHGLAVQSVSGLSGQQTTITQTIGTTSATHYYQVRSASSQVLTVGQQVAISPMPNARGTAASVALIAAGGPIAFVQQGGPGGPGGPDGAGGHGGPPPTGGNPPPGGGPGGQGGQGGTDDAAAPSLNVAGTITARSASSVTIKTSQGKTMKLAVSTATKIYRVVQITRTQLRTGSFVTMNARLVNGKVTARDVVTASLGTTATIFTPGKAIV